MISKNRIEPKNQKPVKEAQVHPLECYQTPSQDQILDGVCATCTTAGVPGATELTPVYPCRARTLP